MFSLLAQDARRAKRCASRLFEAIEEGAALADERATGVLRSVLRAWSSRHQRVTMLLSLLVTRHKEMEATAGEAAARRGVRTGAEKEAAALVTRTAEQFAKVRH
eukprot:4912582-Pleurochrysis_carterae.AAC.1